MANRLKIPFLFSLDSGRGTKKTEVYYFSGTNRKEIIRIVRDVFSEWCEDIGGHCDHYSSSLKELKKIPPRSKMLKIYDATCKRKRKAERDWQIAAAKLNSTDGDKYAKNWKHNKENADKNT